MSQSKYCGFWCMWCGGGDVRSGEENENEKEEKRKQRRNMIWNMGDGHRLLHVGSYHFCVLLWRPLSARSSDSTTTPILYCGGKQALVRDNRALKGGDIGNPT